MAIIGSFILTIILKDRHIWSMLFNMNDGLVDRDSKIEWYIFFRSMQEVGGKDIMTGLIIQVNM